MIKLNQKQDCSGCHVCANVCPVNCITMIEDKEGFLYPKVDIIKCINCGLCEKACPIINKRERVNDTVAYACINKNENIRSESSSGGVFSLLAERVVNKGGVVFGAGFDDGFNLEHSYTDTIEGISKFRGSKYLQSKIGDTYMQAKECLEKGTKVLFSGTPCQISGLLSYLGREYDNLICVDIICHGVPSPKVFKMYRNELEKTHGATTRRIAFRRKDCGWKLYSVSVLFNNDTEYRKNLTRDVFMRGFLQNLYLRPSCYACKSKSLNRLSDITIADFWGIENIAPELNDDKGTSLVLVNDNKGKKIFQQLQDKMIVGQVDCAEAIKYNPSAIESVPYNPNRDRFFENLDSHSDHISKLIIKYTKINFMKRVYGKMRVILSKLNRNILR
ncbi:Coenzyme F420 hydrogenase/dehydrogenase, beta subunit C-terminal domain [Clostridium sp. CF011]|uniref:Coenzyme F420 hydrogenase/dehydrogenase, beta subunit C-terminal domain n=1 Tax=Clostridium sp. CF011 TaxID=2843318 RepID=UPI001C0A9802|nr:Coenzyme F420 hydrogenase/dehydrogenase, beta subunit C-terminal domain [Clostridium sp. CF011]MBU3093644.1 Coenzyme F420 hydrogenase/dehydrogenase, beta subunit C-terminal domain [Clostridium sp. CF011]WAG69350.1 Coenzyme F420 hydrogenase/dehydrogenase, beta subunit C-terminal domain [Clostridium sp. CF011]